MQIANNEVALALLVAVLVTCFLYIYTPSLPDDHPEKQRTSSILFKVFVVSFCISYIVFYFVHDAKGDCPIDNVYRCEPDF